MIIDQCKQSTVVEKPVSYLNFRHCLKVFGSGMCVAALSMCSLVYAWQQDQANITSAYECTQVSLEDPDSALLTKKERIALLDNSLSESIDSYSSCVSIAAQDMSGGGSGQGSGGGGNSANGDKGNQNASGEDDSANLENADDGQNSKQQGQADTPEEVPLSTQPSSRGNSSTPATRGIIPPKDNDKIICKLLFQEITKTQDPDMLKGLKQQYSNYKCG